jgi:hypothetical protein
MCQMVAFTFRQAARLRARVGVAPRPPPLNHEPSPLTPAPRRAPQRKSAIFVAAAPAACLLLPPQPRPGGKAASAPPRRAIPPGRHGAPGVGRRPRPRRTLPRRARAARRGVLPTRRRAQRLREGTAPPPPPVVAGVLAVLCCSELGGKGKGQDLMLKACMLLWCLA